MKETFTSSEILRGIWFSINQDCFDGALNPLNSIGWIDLSDEMSLVEPFGMYYPKGNSIAISHRFNKESRITELEGLIKDQSKKIEEKNSVMQELDTIQELLYRLTLHETIHQAAHQFDNSPFDHADTFLKYASVAASKLGINVPKIVELEIWPDISELFEQ